VNAALNAVESWVTRPEIDFVAPSHHGAVTGIAVDESGLILSAGADGFVVLWDGTAKIARECFQLSRFPIKKIAPRPGKTEIAVYESDEMGSYRISVWDYAVKERRFIIPITNPIIFCGYTARGKYLVLGLQNGFMLFDAETGAEHGEKLGEYPVTLAVSSQTERTLQTYSPSGVLAYWDLDKASLSHSFLVPSNLQNPLVFGSYRFLAGETGGRLFVIDAVSGKTFFETESVPESVLFGNFGADASFARISYLRDDDNDDDDDDDNKSGVLRREDFTVSATGAVERAETLTRMNAVFSAAAPLDDRLFLSGSDDGRLAVAGAEDADFFLFQNGTRILDAAASPSGTIAFTDENGYAAFIPADFTSLLTQDAINLFGAGSSNRVTSGDGGEFLFWHSGGDTDFTGQRRSTPFVKANADADAYLIDLQDSHPLRSAAINGGKVLFLDTSGAIKVFSQGDSRPVFSYASVLSLDAAFVSGRNILVARNAEAGNAAVPFLLADTVSGETLPAAYPALMAFMLYKNRQDSIYAAVLKTAGRNIRTEVIKFDAQNPETSPTVFEYNGEDTDFSFIEYGDGGFAATAGSEGTFIVLPSGETKAADRAPAFPQKLLSWNENFAALDGDGCISWYNGASGRIIAMLRFYETEWLLSTADGTAKRGAVSK
jgi:hypothetical protein